MDLPGAALPLPGSPVGTRDSLLLLGSSGRSSSICEALLPLVAPHFDAVALDTPGFGQSCALPPNPAATR